LLELHEDLGTEVTESNTPFPDDNTDEYDVYAVTFLWGQLGSVPSVDAAPTDWSGQLSSNAPVAIDIRHLIDFEPGQDSLLPVASVATAEWVSGTGWDIDGISFKVRVQRHHTDVVPSALIFETAPITLRFPFHQLEYFAAYYPVGNGQGVAVLARRIWHGSCPTGALRGTWNWHDNTNSNGTFGGLWLDNDGNPIGSYSGEFWTNNDGTRELRGWVSGLTTLQIVAEFKGRWRFDDPRLCPTCGDDHGWFCGKIHWLNNNTSGVMKGHFGDLTNATDAAALPMVAVWKKICPYAHINSTTPAGD
ncbi:MAG: hypothetical protein GY869_13385, partial [Planctomycetes bacterium]|nr:hypothetical protein [Planctomycetota bacterium]